MRRKNQNQSVINASNAVVEAIEARTLLSFGSFDTSFGNAGTAILTSSSTNSVATEPNGNILLAGTFNSDTGPQQSYILSSFVGDPTTSVSGTVFNDTNGDGTQESGETGLAGQTVYADLNNNNVRDVNEPATTTNANGTYVLNGLPQNTAVIVREALSTTQRQSYPAQSAGQHVTTTTTNISGINFGATTNIYVSGTVTLDGNPLSNALVYADLNNDGKFESAENNKTTASDGSFSFVGLPAGSYSFRVVVPAGDLQSLPANNSAITITLPSGGVDSNVSFTLATQAAATNLTGTAIGTSGSYQNDGNTISKAFDGSLTTYFDGPTSNGNTAGLDLGAAKIISQISYAPRSGYASRMVGGTFQASNSADFTSGVTTLYTITSAPTQGVLTNASITNYNAFRYVRYVSPNGSYGDIAELAFYGITPTVGATLEPNGTLVVNGTANADTITVSATGSDSTPENTVTADVNGVTQSFSLNNVTQIVVNAGAGNDTVSLTGSSNGDDTIPSSTFDAITVNGGDGDDSLSNNIQVYDDATEAMVMDGGAGNDSLFDGGSDTATLIGGDGNDTFTSNGYPGLDLYVYGGDGDDTYDPEGDTYLDVYDGGAGTNTIDYTQNGFSVGPSTSSVDLNQYVNVHNLILSGVGDVTVTGSTGNDTITDTNAGTQNISIVGNGGNDTINITDGYDVLINDSGPGANQITVTKSYAVTVIGGDGNDTINVRGNTSATVDGGPGTDTAYTDPGDSVTNVEILNPDQKAQQLTGTVIGTNGSYQNDGNTDSKAFDGNLTTYFDGPDASGDYTGLAFASPQMITQISYAPRNGYAYRMVGGQFQGSNTADFSSGVVTLYTITQEPTNSAYSNVGISNPNSFEYVRYMGPTNSYGDVAEVQFFGTQSTGSAILSSNGTLTITGTNQADTLDIYLDRNETLATADVQVTLNNVLQSFDQSSVHSIVVNTLDGNDRVTIETSAVADPRNSAYYIAIPQINFTAGNGNNILYADLDPSPVSSPTLTIIAGNGNNSVSLGDDTGSGFAPSYSFSAGNGANVFFLFGDINSSQVTLGNGNNSVTLGGPGNFKSLTSSVNVGTGNDTLLCESGDDQITGTVADKAVSLDFTQDTLLGNVYADTNGNGKYDPGEPLVVGAPVSFTDTSFGQLQTTTDSTGNYVESFTTNHQSSYPETISATGFSQQIAPGELLSNINIALPQPLAGTNIGSAGSYQNDGNIIAKALDGNLSTYFDGPTPNGNFAGRDLGTATVITSIIYAPRSTYASRMVGGIFQGSNSLSFANPVNLYTITSTPATGVLTYAAVTNTTAFRYVRYLSPAGSYGDVAEVQFFGTAAVGPKRITGTIIGTPGSYQNDGNTISKVFDGNLSNYFDGPTASGDWAGLDFGSPTIITQVQYAPRVGFASRMVGGEIQASNTADFSSGVVTLFTITTPPTAGVLTTQSLNNSTAYRYYRYLGPANSYSDISELEFDG